MHFRSKEAYTSAEVKKSQFLWPIGLTIKLIDAKKRKR
jgi:hypothetical protein